MSKSRQSANGRSQCRGSKLVGNLNGITANGSCSKSLKSDRSEKDVSRKIISQAPTMDASSSVETIVGFQIGGRTVRWRKTDDGDTSANTTMVRSVAAMSLPTWRMRFSLLFNRNKGVRRTRKLVALFLAAFFALLSFSSFDLCRFPMLHSGA
jgi:hypothetical protein